MKYRKKPIIIEAYQTDVELDIETLEGVMHASIGDYIITGVNGEKYPCKPDIFEKTYELVEESNYETSKELEAFYELKESIEYKGGDFYCANEKRLNVIETAFKKYEELTSKPVILYGRTHGHTKVLIDTICKNYKEVKITNLEDEKKVKAFEVIKEKQVQVDWLIHCYKNFGVKGLHYYNNAFVSSVLTQEEYELLKEVLL